MDGFLWLQANFPTQEAGTALSAPMIVGRRGASSSLLG
jgi:hypothetical protein